MSRSFQNKFLTGSTSLTAYEQGQARDNIDVGVMSGFRNKIRNPQFRINQRGVSFASAGMTSDGWEANTFGAGATGVAVNISVDNVAAYPYGRRNVFLWDRTGGTTLMRLRQKIEGVETLSNRTVTLAILCYAASPIDLTTRVDQDFGTGGSPSVVVQGTPKVHTILSATPTIFYHVMDLASISGKTLGSNKNDCLIVNLDSPATGAANYRILDVALVDGDCSDEGLSIFSPRSIQQELALCQRYYETGSHSSTMLGGYGAAGTALYRGVSFIVTKRVVPTVVKLTEANSNTSAMSPGTIEIDGFWFSGVVTGSGDYFMRMAWAANAEL